MRANRIGLITVIGVAFCVTGVIVGFTVNWLPVQASAEASSVDTLFRVMLAIATVVFLIVEFGIIYSIFRFRRKPGDESDGTPDHGNTALEITWTAIPAVIVFVLTIYSYRVFVDNHTPQQNETVIGITGQQFAWTFTYPYEPFPDLTPEQNEAAKANMISNELHVPSGRPVRVDIRSLDVMHGFYVPEFRIKQDAIPGRVTTTRFTPTTKGQYAVVCSELCGEAHAQMHSLAIVEDPAQFDKFVADMRTRAKESATNPRLASRGKQLMVQKYACGSCHVLDDAGLKGIVGPSLNGIATRAANNTEDRLSRSAVTTPEEYIRLSIVNPGAFIVPGFQNVMPKNFGDPNVMPEDDREAIVNYLMTQK